MPRPERSSILSAHLALVGTQLCFGLFPLFGKLAFESFAPAAVAGWRIVFGAVFLGMLAVGKYGRRVLPTLPDLARMQVLGLLGIAVNQLLYLEGLERSTSMNAGLMMMLVPLFTFVVAVGVRQERFALWRGAGIALALGGTLPLLFEKGPELTYPYLVGNLLMVGNTFLYSIYIVGSKPLMQRYPALVVLAWMYVLCLWTVPLATMDVAWAPARADARAWWSLLAILLLPTSLGYLLHLYALARLRASTTAVYVFVQPLIAGIAGWLILGESLGANTLLGGAAIFAGIWLVLRRA
jgi:drug/metabolite transporter (DMT)-like permease